MPPPSDQPGRGGPEHARDHRPGVFVTSNVPITAPRAPSRRSRRTRPSHIASVSPSHRPFVHVVHALRAPSHKATFRSLRIWFWGRSVRPQRPVRPDRRICNRSISHASALALQSAILEHRDRSVGGQTHRLAGRRAGSRLPRVAGNTPVDATCSPEHEGGSVCRDALRRPDVAGGLLLTRRATARVVLAHAVALLKCESPVRAVPPSPGKGVDR